MTVHTVRIFVGRKQPLLGTGFAYMVFTKWAAGKLIRRAACHAQVTVFTIFRHCRVVIGPFSFAFACL